MTQDLLESYGQVREKIADACMRSGRPRDSVRLLAVSKFQPLSAILQLASGGQEDFGENYVQEAQAKMVRVADLADPPALRWDLIGHIQSRKAAQVAGKFNLIHALDSSRLAQALEKQLEEIGLVQKALLEVNIGAEPQKAGVSPAAVGELAVYILEHCPHVELQGLMCLPPVFDKAECSRPFFARLREIRDSLSGSLGIPLPELSMGMSGDFEVAIEEGATIVRIGTRIFGPRPPRTG